MWVLVISIIVFATIMYIINIIDKNKEKLVEKFNIEKKEIMRCPRCFNEYDNFNLQYCTHCNSHLRKETKYIIPKSLKKKIAYSILGIIAVVTIVISICFGIFNYIKEQQRIEKYNNDLSICYEVIKNDSDFTKFTSIIEEHTKETGFSSDAYKKLYQAIDERIENIKNGNDDEKLINMIKEIKSKNSSNQTIANKYLKANGYSNINKAIDFIKDKRYIEAYELLGTVAKDNKDVNKEIEDLSKNKQNEIKDKTFEQIIAKAKEQINNKEYSKAQSTLSDYKDLGNQTILDMYNKATKEVDRIEKEKKAQEELERRKQQEEERKRQQAELNAKKDKVTINRNGKKIWKVCMTSNTFRFEATYRGTGNFIVKLLDSNQDLKELICNEIGDYNVDKTVNVVKGNYYYIETYVSDGSWNGCWWGTYGD